MLRVTCLHGYFMFREDKPGEVAMFNTRFDQDLESAGDFYTFSKLVDAPDYSIKPLPYLDLPAIATFAGKPHEVMEANQFVYDFQLGVLVPIASVTRIVDIVTFKTMFTVKGLVMPGSVTKTFRKITGYNGFIDTDELKFYYTEFFYD